MLMRLWKPIKHHVCKEDYALDPRICVVGVI